MKNPENRFLTYTQSSGCKKSMRSGSKKLTWNNWNIELSTDILIVKIERKSFLSNRIIVQ